MQTRVRALIALAVATLVLCSLSVLAQSQDPPKQAKKADGGLPDLVAGLKATPGCLGVDTARTSSGKNVIFAWFENKQAVVKWYNSDMHKQLMKKFFPDQTPPKPLKHVADDTGPIMVVASITPTDKPPVGGLALPVSQIAIELYQPLPGGAALGGRFAPSTFKVPQLREYTPQDK